MLGPEMIIGVGDGKNKGNWLKFRGHLLDTDVCS